MEKNTCSSGNSPKDLTSTVQGEITLHREEALLGKGTPRAGSSAHKQQWQSNGNSD